MIKECNNTELKRLIKEFAIISYNNKLINITDKEKKLKLKEYETTIDKIASKEFQIEFKTNCLTKEEEKYFSGIHQIILFSYFKIEEFEKFKKYYFEHENEFIFELNSLYDHLDFFNSEIIISLIEKEKFSKLNLMKMTLMKSKNIEELLIIFNKMKKLLNIEKI